MQIPERFSRVYQRAAERKGGEARLEALVGKPLSHSELSQISDDRFLAAFTQKIFQAGFVWRVVVNKWDGFEEVFWGFDIEKLTLIPDEMLERKAQDPAIIRNYNKVKTVRENAIMIDQIRREHGSFAKFVADWPSDNIIGLWEYLKKHGARLGGNTGAYSLRTLGKDTFIISEDSKAYFSGHDIISGSATSKRSQRAIQNLFNEWQQESKRSYQEISQILAFSIGDNYRHVEQDN